MLVSVPSGPRLPLALAVDACRLEVDEALVADVVDHEGRSVLLADLRDCACGSDEGFELAGGEVTCVACLDRDAVRAIAAARRLRTAPVRRPRAGPDRADRDRGRDRDRDRDRDRAGSRGGRQARAASG
jgi:hypothetical protein